MTSSKWHAIFVFIYTTDPSIKNIYFSIAYTASIMQSRLKRSFLFKKFRRPGKDVHNACMEGSSPRQKRSINLSLFDITKSLLLHNPHPSSKACFSYHSIAEIINNLYHITSGTDVEIEEKRKDNNRIKIGDKMQALQSFVCVLIILRPR